MQIRAQRLSLNNYTRILQMQCEATHTMMAELCSSWNLDKFCEYSTNANSLTTSGKSTKHFNTSNVEGKSSTVSVRKTAPASGPNVVNFTFTATLPNKHVQKVLSRNCHSFDFLSVPTMLTSISCNFYVFICPQQLEKCLYAQIMHAQFDDIDQITSPYCKENAPTLCTVKCDNTRFMEIVGNDEMGLWRDITNGKFWLFFFILLVNWCCMSLGNSLSDTLCFEVLGKMKSVQQLCIVHNILSNCLKLRESLHACFLSLKSFTFMFTENEPEKFGNQRMFGALGWGLVALVSGYLVDWYSEFSIDKDYSLLFLFVCLIFAMDLAAVYSLNVSTHII